MINAKRMFQKVLKQWGYDILLQRRLSDDFVYADQLERYTVRSTYPRNIALARAKMEVPEGVVTVSDYIYYFENYVNPKPGDRIYEESFDSLEDTKMLLIDDTYSVRGRYGEVVYWIVGATKEVPS